jgi:GMP synthase-like glutamine amidotransferase
LRLSRIGLLRCGRVHPAAREDGGCYPELFASLLAAYPLEITTFDADHGELPSSPDDLDGWIISGARASVLDAAGWLDDTAAFVGQALAAERPVVGVCFGHQLLAKLSGGRVERAAGGWGLGVLPYEVVGRQPWMTPAVDRFRLIASHEDQVVELPPDARLLASSDHCPNAMFALGARAVGVQAHPEFTVPGTRRLIDAREELVGVETAAAARTSLAEPPDAALVAGWIAAFLGATGAP